MTSAAASTMASTRTRHNRLNSVEIEVGDAEELVLQYRRCSTSRTATTTRRTSWEQHEVWTNHSTVETVGDEHHRDDQWMLHSVPITADGSGVLTISWEVITDRGLTMGGWNIDDAAYREGHP